MTSNYNLMTYSGQTLSPPKYKNKRI